MRLDSASRAYCKCRAWVYKLAHMTTAYDVGEIPPIGVHHRLRIAREWANLEQSELSERTGISRTSISAAEKGKTKPRKITLNAWALATGVPVSWLEAGNAKTPPPNPNEGPDGGDEVRHQGLEPRTRWFEASTGQGRENVLPLRQPVHPERHVAMKVAS